MGNRIFFALHIIAVFAGCWALAITVPLHLAFYTLSHWEAFQGESQKQEQERAEMERKIKEKLEEVRRQKFLRLCQHASHNAFLLSVAAFFVHLPLTLLTYGFSLAITIPLHFWLVKRSFGHIPLPEKAVLWHNAQKHVVISVVAAAALAVALAGALHRPAEQPLAPVHTIAHNAI